MGLDFLHSIGLKPWIQLSFMPRVLALHPNKYLFNDNVSQPRSNQAWCNLIQVFFQHIRKRYGIEETRTWRYSLWNLPNTASFLYGFDNPEDFQTFYKASFDTIKNEDPAYFISMPPSYYKKYGDSSHGFNRGMNRFGAPGGRTFQRVKVPTPPGSGKGIAEQQGCPPRDGI